MRHDSLLAFFSLGVKNVFEKRIKVLNDIFFTNLDFVVLNTDSLTYENVAIL